MTNKKLTYIEELILKIRKLKSKLHNVRRNEEIFNEISILTKELVELLNVKLINSSDPFWGNVSILLNREMSFDYPAPAAVSYSGYSFNLIINPILFCEFTETEMEAVIIHELYHILNEHIIRGKNLFNKYPRDLINIAADVAINQYIEGLPKNCLSLDWLKKEINKNLSPNREFEYYLEELLKYHKDNEKQQNQSKSDNQDKSDEKKDNDDSNKGSTNDDSEKTDVSKMHDSWETSDSTDDSIEQYHETIKEIIKEASENSRGKIPAGIQDLIKKLDEEPEIKWQNVLIKYLGSIPYGKRKTITRNNRRQPHKIHLRGVLSDRIIKIFVAIDTSGSMRNEDIAKALSNILEITKTMKCEIIVIEFDAEIQKVYKVKRKEDIQYKVSGRGGTALTPVIEYLKEEKEKDALLIVFTDGGTESKIPKPYNRYIMYVLTNDNYTLNIKEPYGPVLKLNANKNKK